MILLGYKVVCTTEHALYALKVSFFITYIETTRERVFANVVMMSYISRYDLT